MSAPLTPKTIEPGWAKRWTLQLYDLWTRSLITTLMVLGMIMAANMMAPRIAMIFMFVVFPISGFIFTLLRALDHSGGVEVWPTAWQYLRGCLKDLWWLSLQLWFFMSIFSISMTMIFLLLSSTFHSPNGLSTLHNNLEVVPFYLRNGVLNGVGWFVLLSMPMSGPVLFLTLSVGNHLLMNVHNTFVGLLKNKTILYAGFFIEFFAGEPFNLSIAWFAKAVSPWLAALLGNFLAAVMVLLMTSYAYLFSRELFEGTTQNEARKASFKVREFVWQHG